MFLLNHEVADCTCGSVGRWFTIQEGYSEHVWALIGAPDQGITLDGLLGGTRILKDDYDASRRLIYADGTIVNERIDGYGYPYVRVIRYPSGRITFSYRTNLKNSDGDYVFSGESRCPGDGTVLDLNRFLHRQSNYHKGDNLH